MNLTTRLRQLRRKVMTRRRDLFESMDFTEGADGKPRLDKEAGIAFGVKILGPVSAHGYGYTDACMLGACPLYEGKAVNVDHPQDRKQLGASRSYRDRFGKLHNVRYVESRGLFGDLHYNKKHELAEQFEYDVEHDPSNLGLSHNASGVGSAKGDFVESITKVRSVDLVADPATNLSLFEDRGGRNMAITIPKKGSKGKSKERKMAEFLEAVAEHDDLAELLEAAAEPAPEDAGPGHDTPLQATAKMAAAIFMDEGMDVATKRAKIGKLLDLIDDAAASPEGGEGEAAEVPEDKGGKNSLKKPVKPAAKPASKGKEKPVVEDKGDLEARLEAMEKREEMRSLCESKGLHPSATQLKSLLSLTEDIEVNELIEDWASKPASGLGPKGAKPKAKSGVELAEGGGKVDVKELKNLLV